VELLRLEHGKPLPDNGENERAMTGQWIRGPWWDGAWLLSGVPIGLTLVGLSRFVAKDTISLGLAILMMDGHLLSPILLAWGHGEFRERMLEQKVWYICLPLTMVAVTMTIGFFSSYAYLSASHMSVLFHGLADFEDPLIGMVTLYMVLNAYHFAKQNFGVMSIYRHKSRLAYRANQRRIDEAFCLLVMTMVSLLTVTHFAFAHSWADYCRLWWRCACTGFIIVGYMLYREVASGGVCLPRILLILTDGLGLGLVFISPLINLAVYSVNHWLVAIGLSSHVGANHWARMRGEMRWYRSQWALALGLLVISVSCYCMLFTSFTWDRGFVVRVTTTAVGLRIGISFIHFLYDRWIWKLSDPRVRTTIGRDFEANPAATRR
jgi:hypothetical protein